ncbi:Uncharacterised protein [Bordetella pertussis]|nr:Uncharacterised protein [Bordetella pertussis]
MQQLRGLADPARPGLHRTGGLCATGRRRPAAARQPSRRRAGRLSRGNPGPPRPGPIRRERRGDRGGQRLGPRIRRARARRRRGLAGALQRRPASPVRGLGQRRQADSLRGAAGHVSRRNPDARLLYRHQRSRRADGDTPPHADQAAGAADRRRVPAPRRVRYRRRLRQGHLPGDTPAGHRPPAQAVRDQGPDRQLLRARPAAAEVPQRPRPAICQPAVPRPPAQAAARIPRRLRAPPDDQGAGQDRRPDPAFPAGLLRRRHRRQLRMHARGREGGLSPALRGGRRRRAVSRRACRPGGRHRRARYRAQAQ